MRYLLETGEDGALQKDIEEVFTIRMSTASRILSLMESNGFIERREVDYDTRLKRVQMNDGEIIENGTHDKLLEAGGFYADLYNSYFEEVAQTTLSISSTKAASRMSCSLTVKQLCLAEYRFELTKTIVICIATDFKFYRHGTLGRCEFCRYLK